MSKTYATDNPNTVRQVNAVIQTACPSCGAAPGFACYEYNPLLHTIFHGSRLMATTFPEDA
jgi:hypothetical protein